MLRFKQVKSVLNKHKKRDNWFLDDYSVNPYEGCSCNCQYCYIRGSKYGENMDEGLFVKKNALEILEKQLAARAKKGEYGFVTVGSGTDAYLHHEARLEMTKGMLELLLKYKFPAFISTKSLLITRDIPLLKEIARQSILPDDLRDKLPGGLLLSISLSTLDENISNTLEPGAARPLERLQLIKQLKEAGFFAGVNAMPLLPFISDTEEELEKIIKAAKDHHADYILAGGLTLFGNGPTDSKTLFYRFLQRYDPALLPRYENLYGAGFYTPFSYQAELKEKAARICRKYGIKNSIIN